LILALSASCGVLVLGVLYGVLVAVGLSIMELLRRRPDHMTVSSVMRLVCQACMTLMTTLTLGKCPA